MPDFCERGLNGEDVCHSPTDFFPWLGDDDNPPTQGHQDCWAGMSTEDDEGVGGIPRGQACDLGCVSCPDLPIELDAQHAPLDGKRWLHPHPQFLSIDATGFNRPIRAGQVAMIPRFATNYLRGPCFNNSGEECFGGSVCACYGERSGRKNITSDIDGDGSGCFPSGGRANLAKGYFGDDFFYYGQGFPTRATLLDMFCRRLVRTTSDEDVRVTLEGGEMLSPAFVRTNYREGSAEHHCVVNMMIRCKAGVPESDCSNAFKNVGDFSDPPQPPPDWYNTAANRSGFDRIAIGGDPHFRSIDNMFDGLRPRDLAHLKVKNEVIKTVFESPFPTADGGTMRFDQIDYEFRNSPTSWSGLNTWSRGWNAAEENIAPNTLPVVTTFPIKAHLVNGDQDIGADLVITRVMSRLWLLPQQVRDRRQRPQIPEIQYHARYMLDVTLGVRFNALRTDAILQQPWLPDDDPERTINYTINYGNGVDPPVFDPPGFDRFVILDHDGTVVDIPTEVKWMGYLGAIGDEPLPQIPIGVRNICRAILGDVRDMRIPGWPTAHATADRGSRFARDRDMAQIHGGAVTIDFVG